MKNSLCYSPKFVNDSKIAGLTDLSGKFTTSAVLFIQATDFCLFIFKAIPHSKAPEQNKTAESVIDLLTFYSLMMQTPFVSSSE